MKRLAIVLPLVLALSGCCLRYSIAPEHMKGLPYGDGDREFVEHYYVLNYGWYLFDRFPLACGDTDPDALIRFSFFSDQVRSDLLMQQFNDRVKATGTEPCSVVTTIEDGVTFDVPGLSFPLVLPYIICFREVQVSGVLTRRSEDAL